MNDIEKLSYIEKKYLEFFERKGYIPKIFYPYGCVEVTEFSPTLTTETGVPGRISSILILIEE